MARPVGIFVKRAICIAGCMPLCFLLLFFLAIQYQQWMLRWRSERLLSDMHTINPGRSTWVDAQMLMHRWGAWGHYDGSCTAIQCKYEIRIVNSSFYDPHTTRYAWLDWLLQHNYLDIYEWLGGRGAAVATSFSVDTGSILKKDLSLGYTVPLKKMRVDNEFEPTLIVNVVDLQQQDETIGEFGILNKDGELSRYPYYKVLNRGGCKVNCEIRYIYYNNRTPPDTIKQLTSFEFSCFTRFNPCKTFEQLLPGVEGWNP